MLNKWPVVALVGAIFGMVLGAAFYKAVAQETNTMIDGVPYRNDMQKYGTYPQP